ncbi:hypothetical protein B0H11DRAFT_1957130 [Mycena galericulata]|nr:hypothetical protein B0H11DRAFT_1957130 [Mycena galericulata]
MKEEETPVVLDEFRSSLSRFSFGSPDKTELRRSPRKPVPVKRLASEIGTSQSDVKSPSKEARRSPVKKQKRAYAPPETYAHLHELQDHLKQDLDATDFTLSPGKKSAEMGHHFGNPSNHFWWCERFDLHRGLLTKVLDRCLHRSGFTDTQLPPQEDFNLPDRFSLGLVSCSHRAFQMELSSGEQLASVPSFLAKIARFRPRIVCFVGLSIAKVVDSSLNVTLSSGTKSWGLRPYKMVHSSSSTIAETLFFAAPSTSGLVTQFQRPEKARIFGELRQIVEKLKAGMTLIRSVETSDPFAASSHTLTGDAQPVKIEETSSVAREEKT